MIKPLFALLLIAIGLGLWARPALAEARTIVALGDSLTAGFGLPEESAFPGQLEAYLRARGHDWRVINAGVSGDTSAGGLARLDWALADKPDLVIVELGANDGLRGLPVEVMESNLDQILARLRAAGIAALLCGMRVPPNLGADYASAFEAVFVRLAANHEIPLYPFFLDGVAAMPSLNQPDGIHPTAEGVAEIVRRIGPVVEKAMKAGS
ncbi:MAG: arylesterase [Alphaproteobacteria bacterium]|nr:arylesterase [Alphaproteobacteria bacterium]